jgi:uncharacterized membrane-anchored protein
MNRARWFVVVVVLQAGFLLGWAGYHEWNLTAAPVILLETAPVDPRDLLRGDYVILAYKIGEVPRPPGREILRRSREIWVSLRQDGRFHGVASASWSRPAPEPGVMVVRGRARPQRRGATALRVDYGIEKYFVPEGRGRPRFEEMVVEATISSTTHRLGIKRLLIDGEVYP